VIFALVNASSKQAEFAELRMLLSAYKTTSAARLTRFHCWNSEVGSKTLGIASFYLRAVCMNRNLWGVEGFEEISIRHSKFAAQRFAHEAAPALTSFANSSPAPFVAGIKAAREKIVARTDEDRETFLRKRGFSKTETTKIIETVLSEEGHPPASIFDFVQGITAQAYVRMIG
jgi:hypothetical protein